MPSSSITNIPNLQRCFLFSTNRLSRLVELATVHSAWADTIHNYSHGILQSWQYPSQVTLNDLINIEHDREVRFARECKIVDENVVIDEEDEKNVSREPPRYADERSVVSQFPRSLSSMMNSDDDASSSREGQLKDLKKTLETRARRIFSGALVRACQLGIRWLVSNICESPSHVDTVYYNINKNKNHDEDDEGRRRSDQQEEEDRLPTCLVDPATCQHYSGVPIFAACSSGCLDIVRYLISKRPNIARDAIDLNERTPLFIAASQGNIEMMKVLLEDGKVDVHHQDYSNDDVLQFCAYQGSLKAMKFLIFDEEIKASRIFKRDSTKEFRKRELEKAIVAACSLDQFHVMQYLALNSFGGPDRGFAAVDEPWQLTMTPGMLDSAARSGSVKGVLAILENVRRTSASLLNRSQKNSGEMHRKETYDSVLRSIKYNLKDDIVRGEIETLIKDAKNEFCG